ncbi:MAG: sugar phosphate isomerase/epimerase [Pirellulales bacterium]|nr:sugar phosphate isomerase/epimerase [Pirellulales bacterium]
MKLTVNRREFVAGSCAALAGVALGRMSSGFTYAPTEQKLAVGCRDVHLKVTGADDCWAAMRTIGAESVAATVGDDLSIPALFHPSRKYTLATAEGIEQLAADAKAAGVKVTAFCMSNRFDTRPDFELEWTAKAAEAAKALGAKAIRIDVVPHKLSPQEFPAFAVEILGKLVKATESTGVRFGMENHGGTTNNPEFLRTVFQGVGSDRLGLTLDTANFYWFGHPLSKLYDLYAEFAPRVVHTHCKSIRYPESERETQRQRGWKYGDYCCPIYEGDIDFRRVVEILRKAGYANDLCIENESLGKFPQAEQGSVLAREIEYLKELR